MIASRANVGRISAAGSDHRGLHQKFRGSKVAQEGNRVNVAGHAAASERNFHRSRVRWMFVLLAQSCKKGKNVPSHASNSLDRRVLAMKLKSSPVKTLARAASFLILLAALVAMAANGQDKGADTKPKADSGSKDVRLTIVVTAGEDKKPVDGASVYVRFVEERKLGKDKKVEMNLKTNQSGVCHIPVLPSGKFAIQVIAEGWKTYGEYYDINQTEQTINITLVRPPKWY
jgi:hypothetical protein